MLEDFHEDSGTGSGALSEAGAWGEQADRDTSGPSSGSGLSGGAGRERVERPEISEESGSGRIERIDCEILSGWVAGPDLTRLDAVVTVWIDGAAVAEVPTLSFRKDLAKAGIADGHGGFAVDVSSSIPAAAKSVDVALSVPGDDGDVRFVARRTVNLHVHEPVNANPLMRSSHHDVIDDWTLDHDHRVGLRVERFPMSGRALDYADRYTRLSFLDRTATDGSVRLSCPIELARPVERGLQFVLVTRSEHLTTIACRLYRGDALLTELHLQTGGEWCFHRKGLSGTAASDLTPNGPLGDAFRTAFDPHLRFEIDVPHRGRGNLDIAVCCIAEEPSCRHLRRSREALDAPADGACDIPPRSLVSNGRFERWSRGIDFDPITPGRELADGWFFECRKGMSSAVTVRMDTAPRSRDGMAISSPSFGVRVRTDAFEGPMRVLTLLDPVVLAADAVAVRLGLHALGRGGTGLVRRVYLLARGVGCETIVHVLARKQRVRGHLELELSIGEVDMSKVRRACRETSVLALVCEFEEHGDILIDTFDAWPVVPSLEPDLDGQESETAPTGFEDEAVAAQLSLVKGLESWSTDVPTDASAALTARRTRERAATTDIGSIRPATIRRPFAGYPSVDIVVPVYNALESVRECVRSVLENTTVPYTLVCIDDGSDEGTARYLAGVAERFGNVVMLTNEENIGYTRTVNRGLRYSNADYLCVLNSDCIVTPNWLMQLLDCAISRPEAGMVGPLSNAASYQSVPRIRSDAGGWCFNPLPSSISPADMAALVNEHSLSAWPRVRIINGFCQLIRREVIDVIGLLDEEAFPRGFGEENDFCARAVAAGFAIHVADDTYVFHTKSQSFGHATRTVLSKEGSAALRKKHPDIDWNSLTRELELDPALVQLRHRIIECGL